MGNDYGARGKTSSEQPQILLLADITNHFAGAGINLIIPTHVFRPTCPNLMSVQVNIS